MTLATIQTPVDISKLGVLIRLTVRQPGFASASKTLKEEAAQKHEADRNSLRALVLKFTEEKRQFVTAAISNGRTFLYEQTLPWDDGSYRLCPTKRYPMVRAKLGEFQNAFLDAVDDLLVEYDTLREDYNTRVGTMLARENPFPSLSELQSAFAWEVKTMSLPKPEEVNLTHVSTEVVNEIRESMVSQYEERLTAANMEIVQRLETLVGRVKEQTGKEKGKIFDSLIGNLQEAVEILPDLNVTDDPKVTKLIDTVQREMTMIDPAQLRSDDKYRLATNKVANRVFDEIQNFKS